MANITANLLSTTINAADDAALGAAGGQLESILALYLVSLSEEERKSLFSLDVENKVFAEQALDEAQHNGSVLPTFIQPTELEKDITFWTQLDNMESRLLNLLQKIKDTKRRAGHEAYAMAVVIYGLYESAHVAGIPGATQSYNRLKERFAGQGGGRPTEPTP